MVVSKDKVVSKDNVVSIREGSIVKFYEHGYTGDIIKGVVVEVDNNLLIVDSFDGNSWCLHENNVTLVLTNGEVL